MYIPGADHELIGRRAIPSNRRQAAKGTDTGARVNITVEADFDAAAAPFRHELVVHCYRMLGSVQDAEDVAQETLIRRGRPAAVTTRNAPRCGPGSTGSRPTRA